MKKAIQMFFGIFVLTVCIGCSGEPDDKITSVNWSDDGQIAMVNYEDAMGEQKSFQLHCGDDSVETPFTYEWEADCDLNTKISGSSLQDWDNPTDNDMAEMAIGAAAGALMGSVTKKTTKKKTKKKTSKSSKKKK